MKMLSFLQNVVVASGARRGVKCIFEPSFSGRALFVPRRELCNSNYWKPVRMSILASEKLASQVPRLKKDVSSNFECLTRDPR